MIDLEQDFNNFMSGIFQKLGIELQEELTDDYSLENDTFALLNSFEDYVENVIKRNNDLIKQKVVNNL